MKAKITLNQDELKAAVIGYLKKNGWVASINDVTFSCSNGGFATGGSKVSAEIPVLPLAINDGVNQKDGD